eukprot:scaffold38277_cov52-Phaeocystis_antarctica.AAC.1
MEQPASESRLVPFALISEDSADELPPSRSSARELDVEAPPYTAFRGLSPWRMKRINDAVFEFSVTSPIVLPPRSTACSSVRGGGGGGGGGGVELDLEARARRADGGRADGGGGGAHGDGGLGSGGGGLDDGGGGLGGGGGDVLGDGGDGEGGSGLAAGPFNAALE